MFLGAVAVGDCCPSQVTKKWEGEEMVGEEV